VTAASKIGDEKGETGQPPRPDTAPVPHHGRGVRHVGPTARGGPRSPCGRDRPERRGGCLSLRTITVEGIRGIEARAAGRGRWDWRKVSKVVARAGGISYFHDRPPLKGMIIIENPDRAAFREAMKPVFEQFQGQFGKDLVQRIVNTK